MPLKWWLKRLLSRKKEELHLSLRRISEIERHFVSGDFSASEAADTVELLCRELRRRIDESNGKLISHEPVVHVGGGPDHFMNRDLKDGSKNTTQVDRSKS